MNILQFVSSSVWKSLFDKPADSLERSMDRDDEFMIVDYEPLTSAYCSVPADYSGQLSADAYISGMVAGILAGAGFGARVTAHNVALEAGEQQRATQQQPSSSAAIAPFHRREKAVFLVKFDPDVAQRDVSLG